MELTLDPISVNTEAAENYLKKYNSFNVWPAPGKFWHVEEYPDVKVEDDIANYSKHNNINEEEICNFIKPNAVIKLVDKIQENKSLFCQLEYLIRNTDEADVENNLKLICQYILSCENLWDSDDAFNCRINIHIDVNTPLYVLGCVAMASLQEMKCSLISTQKMAPICYLFTDLCAQLGWRIPLIFVVDHETFNYSPYSLRQASKEWSCECTGVVTDSADIDSALDVIINSTVTAPWKFKRLYVQENVYDEVKDALAARCDRDRSQASDDVFDVKGKLFVCEGLGEEQGDAARVLVEAYRTAKELCALLQQNPTPTLSVWAADSQLAHEIALAAPAALIWLNDYASFHGPPTSSLPLFERLYKQFECPINENKVKDLKSSWIKWIKLTKNERIQTIMNTLNALKTVPEGFESVEELQNLVLKGRDDSFVSVENGKICFGVERPLIFEDFIVAESTEESAIPKYIITCINGAPVINLNKCKRHPTILDLYQSLEQAGVPIMSEYSNDEPEVNLYEKLIRKKLKIIRSNFGTIFAN